MKDLVQLYYPFPSYDSIKPEGEIIDLELQDNHTHTTATKRDVYGDLYMDYREKKYIELEKQRFLMQENTEAMDRRKKEIGELLKGLSFSTLRKLAIAKPMVREYYMREINGINSQLLVKKIVKELEDWEPMPDNWEPTRE